MGVWTCDQYVVGVIPTGTTQRNNLGQAAHTMCLCQQAV